MSEKFTKLIPMKFDDPLRQDKYWIINGINYLGDLINSVNRDMENRILLVISIILSSIIGFLLATKHYLISINVGLVLLILLILSLLKEAKAKLKLNKRLSIVYTNALNNGIKLK